WVFSDGSRYNTKVVSHTFTESGCNQVRLYRFRPECTDSMIIECFEVIEKPSFSWEITNQYSCSIPAEINLKGEGDGNFTWAFHNKNGIDTLRGKDVK